MKGATLPGSPVPFQFGVGVELYHAARCICWFCREQVIEYGGSRRWRNFTTSLNCDVEIEFMGKTLRARAHKECAQGENNVRNINL